MQRLAIIPARSGSKGLKDKNIADLCGKPVLAYSIEAALMSELLDRVIVSTDSERYANIAQRYGAEVMMRNAQLASDTATTYMVIEDVLKRIKQRYDCLVLLQPTSPLRTSTHLIEAIELFDANCIRYDFLVSVKKSEFGKDLVNIIEEDGSMKHFDKDFSQYRRQAYDYYSPNGAIFIAKTEAYLHQGHFFGPRAIAYKMNAEDSIDIDHQIDLDLAKLILKNRHGEQI